MKHLRTYFILTIIAFVIASCTDGEQMRQRLADVQACNQADTVFSSRWLPTVDSLVDYFDSHGTPNERLVAHYLQGRVYHDMGEAPQAIDCYQQAVEQVDTAAEDCDFRTLMSVYGQMSLLFSCQFLPDDEISALRMAAKMAHKNKDTLTEIIALDRLSDPYFLKKDTNNVLLIEEKAREMYLKHGYKEYAGQAILGSIRIALNRHNTSEAERLLNIYRNESGLFDSNGDLIRGGTYYVDKGVFLTQVGNLDSAQYYFRRAISQKKYEGGYQGLLSVYEKKNLPDSIAKYARLFANANDSSFLHVNQESVHRISSLYNFTRQQKIAAEQSENAREANRQKRGLIVIVLLITVVSFFVVRRLRKQSKVRYLKLVSRYDRSKAELSAALDRQRLLHYDYELALRSKEEEQQLQLQTIIEEIQQKKSEIQLLKEKVQSQEVQLQRFSSAEMEKEFKKSNVYHLFDERKSSKYINRIPEEKDWDELTDLFRTHFVRFNTFIAYDHHLSIQQYRYCILFRLGFDNNEIGILMNKDINQRHHLRKFICESLFGKSTNIKMLDSLLKEHF